MTRYSPTPSDVERTATLIQRLFAAYPTKHLGNAQAAMVIYVEELSRFRPSDLEQAISQLFRSERMLPSIAQVNDAVQAVLRERQERVR